MYIDFLISSIALLEKIIGLLLLSENCEGLRVLQIGVSFQLIEVFWYTAHYKVN